MSTYYGGTLWELYTRDDNDMRFDAKKNSMRAKRLPGYFFFFSYHRYVFIASTFCLVIWFVATSIIEGLEGFNV